MRLCQKQQEQTRKEIARTEDLTNPGDRINRKQVEMKSMKARKLNPALMTTAEAAEYLGCSIDAVKEMKRTKRIVGVSFGRSKSRSRYVTRESVERVLRGEV